MLTTGAGTLPARFVRATQARPESPSLPCKATDTIVDPTAREAALTVWSAECPIPAHVGAVSISTRSSANLSAVIGGECGRHQSCDESVLRTRRIAVRKMALLSVASIALAFSAPAGATEPGKGEGDVRSCGHVEELAAAERALKEGRDDEALQHLRNADAMLARCMEERESRDGDVLDDPEHDFASAQKSDRQPIRPAANPSSSRFAKS